MKMRAILLALLLAIPLMSSAQWMPAKSNRMVNDYAHLLSSREAAELEQRLESFSDTTSQSQVVVITTNTLGGGDIMTVGQQIGQKWGIGGKSMNNGVLLLILASEEEGNDVAILTGYGSEAVLPDVVCKHIIDEELIPHFKEGSFYGGIDAALDVILPIMHGEFSSGDYMAKKAEEERVSNIIALLIFIVIIVVIVWASRKSKNGGSGSSGSSSSGGPIFWGGSPFMGGSSSGGFPSGGGFGGFGGGSFGGGGAHGKW
ncbi:MAG: TPM domain-containing protein [Bacteroidales bacterium]|nr:TPM domain-containing protein [Bacteroidales bacterium]